ncbi:unnamed protein product, partial [Polarella glacialis]
CVPLLLAASFAAPNWVCSTPYQHKFTSRALRASRAAGPETDESRGFDTEQSREDEAIVAAGGAEKVPPGVGRIGGKSSAKSPFAAAPPPAPRRRGAPEEHDGGATFAGITLRVGDNYLVKVLAVLLAVWVGRFVLETTLFGGGNQQDSYYVSSSSYVMTSTVDESGQRTKSVQKSSTFRTNIAGLRSPTQRDLPASLSSGQWK